MFAYILEVVYSQKCRLHVLEDLLQEDDCHVP